jgi:hypothetical protein
MIQCRTFGDHFMNTPCRIEEFWGAGFPVARLSRRDFPTGGLSRHVQMIAIVFVSRNILHHGKAPPPQILTGYRTQGRQVKFPQFASHFPPCKRPKDFCLSAERDLAASPTPQLPPMRKYSRPDFRASARDLLLTQNPKRSSEMRTRPARNTRHLRILLLESQSPLRQQTAGVECEKTS